MRVNSWFFIWAAIILIFLKLIGEISWPWIWVLCPLWMPFVIILGVFGIILVLMIVCGIIRIVIEARS